MVRRLAVVFALSALGAGPPDPMEALRHAPDAKAAAALEQRIVLGWRERASGAVQLLLASAQTPGRPAGAAMRDADAAVTLDPGLAEAWRIRGETRLAAGDTAGAIADFGQALARDGHNFAALAALSRAEEARGNDQAALKAWSDFLALDPQSPGGEARRRSLEDKVRGRPT